ncbi:hypothetical protein KM043_004159 [Ampulex compressa]|nr:hypothetical protein KM043_004159 [Ampulex compressa]
MVDKVAYRRDYAISVSPIHDYHVSFIDASNRKAVAEIRAFGYGNRGKISRARSSLCENTKFPVWRFRADDARNAFERKAFSQRYRKVTISGRPANDGITGR